MAGTPFRNEQIATVEANREQVLEWLAEGKSQSRIAEMLGVTKANVTRWIQRSPENEAAVLRARAFAAHTLAESSIDRAAALLERPLLNPETGEPVRDAAGAVVYREPSTGEIQATKLLTDNMKWAASHWNRSAYGQQAAQLSVNVNLGSAALDSLRKAQVAPDVIDVEPTMQPALEGPSLDDLL